jgi:hypothetical protein
LFGQLVKVGPNNSFKPNLLRSTKAMAEKACHGFGSTTQVGLTQALALTNFPALPSSAMRRSLLLVIFILLLMSDSYSQEFERGVVYSYLKDGRRHYSASPPPEGVQDVRELSYNIPISNSLLGTWVEKHGNTSYTFGSGYNLEFRTRGLAQHGIWAYAPGNCAVGDSQGNLYIQAGTDRCCHSASLLGSNLVLSAVVQPRFVGVCSDRVLVREQTPGEG